MFINSIEVDSRILIYPTGIFGKRRGDACGTKCCDENRYTWHGFGCNVYGLFWNSMGRYWYWWITGNDCNLVTDFSYIGWCCIIFLWNDDDKTVPFSTH